jgi:hypothetical protein
MLKKNKNYSLLIGSPHNCTLLLQVIELNMGFIYKFIIMDTANVNANYYFVRSKRVSVHKLAQRLEDFCTGQRGRLNSLRNLKAKFTDRIHSTVRCPKST